MDALTGWDEDATAEAYAAFTRAWPMYPTTSRDLAARADLADGRLVVDLCGGTGVTAQAILEHLPTDAAVVSVDSAAAMQRVGQRLVRDPRLSWITAPAETLDAHLPPGAVDAVVCNSAVWKTDVAAVATAVSRVLRPAGRFVFNIGGGFAGLPRPTEGGPSLHALIDQIAARDHRYTPPPPAREPKMPLDTVTRHLANAGLTVVDTAVLTQHTTMAERKAWLSIPAFARPTTGFTYAQQMQILEQAYALTRPEAITETHWLVLVALKVPHHV